MFASDEIMEFGVLVCLCMQSSFSELYLQNQSQLSYQFLWKDFKIY